MIFTGCLINSLSGAKALRRNVHPPRRVTDRSQNMMDVSLNTLRPIRSAQKIRQDIHIPRPLHVREAFPRKSISKTRTRHYSKRQKTGSSERRCRHGNFGENKSEPMESAIFRLLDGAEVLRFKPFAVGPRFLEKEDEARWRRAS